MELIVVDISKQRITIRQRNKDNLELDIAILLIVDDDDE